MQATVHKYHTGHYFNAAARVYGWLATTWALYAVIDGSVAAWLVLPTGLLVQFTYYHTEFDLGRMTYREGVWLAGMTSGKKRPLPGFDFLFLKNNRYSQTLESRASMTTLKVEKYDGYVQLTNQVKLHLLRHNNKEKALRRMEQIARDLNTELRDLTEMKYY
jgi:hypothetical protein